MIASVPAKWLIDRSEGFEHIATVSATELLEQLKVLPPEQQAAFAQQFEQWQAHNGDAGPHSKVQWPDPRPRHQRIFGEKVIPNMVLVGREEERY